MAANPKKVYPVRMKVTETHPTCAAGHKVGDEWIWEDTTPPGICSSIFACSFNAYLALRYGGKEPEAEKVLQSRPGEHGAEGYTNEAMTMIYRRCPDPNKRVVISLERIVDDLDKKSETPSGDKSQ
ncbi:MAG: TIGR04076 family protein [Anaerolineae bacterium]|nr:TIGR04076 family protein [Anaerolineae bacterium]MBN8617647.1 TIGR04076 family protein [Anaerolineae bacterium]